jgi:hypothetical protein
MASEACSRGIQPSASRAGVSILATPSSSAIRVTHLRGNAPIVSPKSGGRELPADQTAILEGFRRPQAAMSGV